MAGQEGVSIRALANRMAGCFIVALVAAWALVGLNLHEIDLLAGFLADERRAFALDLALRTASFLGFFMGLCYFLQLRPRLKRVAELVGERW